MTRPLNVMVVDDCEIDQFFAKRELDKVDWLEAIHQFGNPQDALSYVARNDHAPIDLMLLDFRMPEMTGLDLVKAIHRDKLETRVGTIAIMLTVPLPPSDDRALRALDPSIQFLPKPLTQDHLDSLAQVAS